MNVPPTDRIEETQPVMGFWLELRGVDEQPLFRRIMHDPIAHDREILPDLQGGEIIGASDSPSVSSVSTSGTHAAHVSDARPQGEDGVGLIGPSVARVGHVSTEQRRSQVSIRKAFGL